MSADRLDAARPLLGLEPRLVKNLKAKAGSEIAIKLARMAVVALAARWLGSAAFGAYSYALTIATILVQFADFGLQLHLAREVALSPAGAGIVVARVGRAKGLLSLGVVVALAAVGLLAVRSAGDRAILWIVGPALLLASFVETADYLFRGFQRLDYEARLNLLQMFLGGALALAAVRAGLGARGFAAGLLCGAAVSLAVALRWIHSRFVPAREWLRRGAGTTVWDAIRPSAPIGIAIVLSTLYFRVDVLILEAYRGKEAVGLYTAAHKVIEATMVLPAILLSAVFPAFSERAARGSEHERDRLYRVSLAWLLALSVPVAGAAALLAPAIVRAAFGAAYLPAAGALRILSPAIVLIFLNYGLTHFLIGLGRQRTNAIVMAICVVVNVAGNRIAIPRYGMGGAAAMAVVTEAVLFGLAYPLVRRGLREPAR